MFRGLRTIVMWLIALTIPLQGVAAATMPLCAPSHHAAASAKAGGPDGPMAQLPLADAADPHALHKRTATHHTDDSAHHGSAAHGKAGQSGHDVLKCCSATCSMAAVTSVPSLAARSPQRSPNPLHPVASRYRGVTLDGLDRPPRRFLA